MVLFDAGILIKLLDARTSDVQRDKASPHCARMIYRRIPLLSSKSLTLRFRLMLLRQSSANEVSAGSD